MIATQYLVLSVWFLLAKGELRTCRESTSISSAPGTLVSHLGYGTVTLDSPKCEWIITPPIDQYVAIDIQDTGNAQCNRDILIYSHLGGNRYPGWYVCGDNKTSSVNPKYIGSGIGNWIRIKVVNNSPGAKLTGFSLNYDFKDAGCSGVKNLTETDTNQWFASHPGAGRWAVPAIQNCAWRLIAPEGMYVSLHADVISLHCENTWQTMAFYDSDGPLEDHLIARVSCTGRLSPIASTGRYMYVSYKDLWEGSGRGFNISYKFHEQRQSGCGSKYLRDDAIGVIASHDWLSEVTYHDWSRCNWRILAPEGTGITLRFDVFDVRSSSKRCTDDMLVVYDGALNHTQLGQMFCNGDDAPPMTLTSTSNDVNIRFIAGSSHNLNLRGRGFSITYLRTCKKAPVIHGTDITYVDSNQDGTETFTVGEDVYYSCRRGYIQSGGNRERHCSENGQITGKDLICRPVLCSGVPRIPHADVTFMDLNMDGLSYVTYQEVTSYTCKMGYEISSGDTQRRCQEDGTFEGENLICSLKLCKNIPTIKLAVAQQVDSNGDGDDRLTYTEEVVYHCQDGYSQIDGNQRRVCQADGNLSGVDLVCKPVICSGEANITNAVQRGSLDLNQDGEHTVSFTEERHYACLEGYTRTSGNFIRQCTTNGTFNGTDLICEEIICPDLKEYPHSSLEGSGTGSRRTYGSEVTYVCVNEYSFSNGSATVTLKCGKEGMWEGAKVECTLDKSDSDESSDPLIVDWIMIVVISAVLTVVVICFVCLCIILHYEKRRRKARKQKKWERKLELWERTREGNTLMRNANFFNDHRFSARTAYSTSSFNHKMRNKIDNPDLQKIDTSHPTYLTYPNRAYEQDWPRDYTKHDVSQRPRGSHAVSRSDSGISHRTNLSGNFLDVPYASEMDIAGLGVHHSTRDPIKKSYNGSVASSPMVRRQEQGYGYLHVTPDLVRVRDYDNDT
ncbi:unnamed protein product [Owenia fusiformis]|uniref:Uncharacterized protein n=1 Tax=Owenia fusiformis TaxID=6347 RepID=A0A8J1UEA3_OWEFU|nr:unnamed protein product [Owenia fusiformis]